VTEPNVRDKVVIVTGAGRGLGKAMTLGLVKAGARVTMVELDRDVLEAAAKEAKSAGGEKCVIAVAADVTKRDDAKKIVEQTIASHGGLHVLMNNAAIGPQAGNSSYMVAPKKFWEVDPEIWRRTLEVNATGVFTMCQAVLPHLIAQKWGRVLTVTTSLDTMTRGGIGAYGPAKASAEAMMAVISDEVAGTGVTANVLVPGGPANTRMIPNEGVYAKRDQLIQPEVMVPPLLWLCSPAADGVNARRFRAAAWDPKIAPEKAAEAAGAPIAWTGLGRQSIHPKG
jgi:3-oxoacyl-[acyl-carrier protein] reductase